MKNKISILVVVSLFLLSCQSTTKKKEMADLIDRTMIVAQKHAVAMAASLPEGRLPRTCENERLNTSDSKWWCSGFYPGVLWYLYEYTNNDSIRKLAEEFTMRVENEKYTTDNHDVGFILFCSFGNGLRLTGNESYKEILLTGAKSLSTRFNGKVGLIRSWDWTPRTHVWQYPVIIDNMMNLELLLWASEYSKDPVFKNIAYSHSDKTIEHLFRPDNSSYHVVSFDPETGIPEFKMTWQGVADESAWARGQAWGLYGFTYMYRETKEKRYLEQAQKIANFIINHPRLPGDKIPFHDFDDKEIPNTYRDASAGAIICSALVELSVLSDEPLKTQYLDVATQQIKTLASEQFLAKPGTNCNFILKHGVGTYNEHRKGEVDVPLTYADYYFMEAMVRYQKMILKK